MPAMEPIKIADIEKSRAEIIRIEISEYKDRKYLNIRTWYKNDEGEYSPTKKGVALALDKISDLKMAIEKAENISQELS